MPKLIRQKPPASCGVLVTTQEDYTSIGKDHLLRMLLLLYLIRGFEEAILDLQQDGLVHGPVHTCVGQEAVAVGSVLALRKSDMIATTHRPHGHFLAKALLYYAPDDYDPLTHGVTTNMQDAVNRTLAEILGLQEGWCGGRGGSMHLYDAESGNLGSNGIVGGGIPIATGAAWAQKIRGTNAAVLCFLGDGAVEQGCFHEAANMAALWEVPVVFVVENNQYAVATPVSAHSAVENLAARGFSYGIDGVAVDGMDVVNVYLASRDAVQRARDGIPSLIEARTYRFYHHAGRMPGSAFGYRTREEEKAWSARDPLVVFPEAVVRLGLVDKREDDLLRQAAVASVEEALHRYTKRDEGRPVIKPEHWPDPSTLTRHLRCQRGPWVNVQFVERDDFSETRDVSFVEAIAQAMLSAMKRDPAVLAIGEEVANLRGGCFGATRGIAEVFPLRLINTPISEAGFVGMAAGAAAVGIKPVVEIMFPDFALVAADQLFNQIAKLPYMFNGRLSFPFIVRTRVAAGTGHGGQHSMDPCGLFALFPGWRIVAPSTPFDYIGLFNTALALSDPTLIVEHAALYPLRGPIPVSCDDYYVEYGKAKIVREGVDVTALSYLSGVPMCVQAADLVAREGIRPEIVDLRTVDHLGIDFRTIEASVKKTGTLVIVEQCPRSCALGFYITHEIQQRVFDYLDAPIAIVAGEDVPAPVSRTLERACLPSIPQIATAMRNMARRVPRRP